MFRISKLADYGVSLLAALAADRGGEPHTARGMAGRVGLPLPTVSKILKALSRQGLLVSHRGVRGGYVLARPPEEITVAEIIRALEGPIGMTECAACVRALDLFVLIYGAEAGNQALRILARGGVCIGGGIAPRILDKLKDGVFLRAFLDKGRLSGLLREVPVRVILADRAPLLGAASLAARLP